MASSTEKDPNSGQSGAAIPNESDPEHPLIPPNRLNELDLNDCAVEIRNMKFYYNRSKKILDNFSLTFPRGAMYL